MKLFVILVILAVFIFLLMIIYMYIEAHLNRLLYYELNIEELPDAFENFRIFFISDIHRRKISPRLLSELKMKPDLVIIGGDLTENGVSFQKVEENVKILTKLGPALFVWGNHDLQVNRDELMNILRKYGVKVLENSTYILARGDALFNIIGVGDVANEQDDLQKALGKSASGWPSILISHNPDIKYKLNKSHNISYTLSGHTHGGQIRMFGLGIREAGGVKKHPFGTLIISNGYGTTQLPFRLAARPDALVLTLKGSKD